MVSSVTNSGSATTAAASNIGAGSTMGKDEFLKLLVAQLQNQDPLNPQDPTAFTAQLAQFSQLEQLTNANTNLSSLVKSNQSVQQLSAFSLIGRTVEAESSTVNFSGAPVNFAYTLDDDASSVSVKLLDADGKTVAELPDPATDAGTHFYTWDGTGLDGQQLPYGDYTLVAQSSDGTTATDLKTLVRGTVSGVDTSTSGNQLVTEAGTFDMTDVVSVKD